MTISATMVKALRDKTGAGMMDCKRALSANDGDMELSLDWLRKKGQAIANKKALRKASEGLISALIDDSGKIGVILETNCETDFVARNEGFVQLCDTLIAHIAAGGEGTRGSVDDYLAAPAPGDSAQTVQDFMKEKIAALGEKLAVGAFARVEVDGDGAYLHSYIHPPGKLGVLVEIAVGQASTKDSPAFKEFCDDLTMHIAAASPECLKRDQVDPSALERERNIFRDQALAEGKPEKIIEKIIEGKLRKFYSQVCLLDQEFVKDSDLNISQLVDKVEKEIGGSVEIKAFHRLRIGG